MHGTLYRDMSHAIPTGYAGVQFRSRLEARWAAMFDQLGWSWEYEPIDLAGYIPDFILKFEQPLLVEVKPALVPEDYLGAQEKIDQSGWVGPAWVVGAFVDVDDAAHAGTLSSGLATGWGWRPAQIEYVHRGGVDNEHAGPHPGHWSPHSEEGLWGCRVHHGGCAHKLYGSFYRHVDKLKEIKRVWREAGNRVQWKRPTVPIGTMSKKELREIEHLGDQEWSRLGLDKCPCPDQACTRHNTKARFFCGYGHRTTHAELSSLGRVVCPKCNRYAHPITGSVSDLLK